MAPPAPAPPAILAYLTLANKLSVSWDAVHYMKPPSATPPCLAPNASSREWDAEWMRAFHLADTSKPLGATFSGAFIPGSLEGVWEGLFTVRHLPPVRLYFLTGLLSVERLMTAGKSRWRPPFLPPLSVLLSLTRSWRIAPRSRVSMPQELRYVKACKRTRTIATTLCR